MNPVLQNILDRHSCRSFTEQPVEQEKLQDLLTAAVWAPSGRNEQSWHFTLLANTEKIQALAAAVREADNRPAGYNFFAPAAFLIVSGERDNRNSFLDAGAAMENVLLTEYGVPENHIVNASAAIGYPAAQPVIHERKANTTTLVR